MISCYNPPRSGLSKEVVILPASFHLRSNVNYVTLQSSLVQTAQQVTVLWPPLLPPCLSQKESQRWVAAGWGDLCNFLAQSKVHFRETAALWWMRRYFGEPGQCSKCAGRDRKEKLVWWTHTHHAAHTHTTLHIYYTHCTGVKTLETVGISISLRHGLVSLRWT